MSFLLGGGWVSPTGLMIQSLLLGGGWVSPTGLMIQSLLLGQAALLIWRSRQR